MPTKKPTKKSRNEMNRAWERARIDQATGVKKPRKPTVKKRAKR
jgi:hypothetical protein